MKVSGIVLAGGKSSRMSINKAFLEIKNLKIIEAVLNKVGDFCDEVILVTNTPDEYIALGVKVVTDIFPQKGPLSGIHAGLRASGNDYSFIIACDMPFLNPDLGRFMVEQAEGYDAVVPIVEGRYQPLYAVYSRNCIKPVEKSLREGKYKVTSFYPEIKVKSIDEKLVRLFADPEELFFNINTIEDYRKAKDMAGEGKDGTG